MHLFQFPEQKILDRMKNIVHSEVTDIEWPNAVVNAKNTKYEKIIHESSFSIFTNEKGSLRLNANNRDLKICEQTFYISNPYESFSYEIDSEETVETFNIHLNYDFYTKALYASLNSHEELLDKPFDSDKNYIFTNQLHIKTHDLKNTIRSYQEDEEELFFTQILTKSLVVDNKEKRKQLQIPAAKKSTKKELARRMYIAKDYIYSNYSNADLSVKQLSEEVSMSSFHFLRTFTKMYKISPYQYIKAVRIAKAKQLLKDTSVSITEIAFLVGFKEATAIFPILKKQLAKTPEKYRREISNFE